MAQAPTVADPKRLPLVIEPENRDESTNKDAKLINGYVEKNDKTGEFWVFKRPGLLQDAAWTTKVGNGNGVYNWNSDIYAIFGATLYKNNVSIGTVDDTNGVYRFSSSLGAIPRLVMQNAVKGYVWDNTTLAQLAGPNYPGNTYIDAAVKGWAYLDGTTYIMDVKAYIHGSDVVPGLNRPDLWTELTNMIGAQIEPDRGVALAKQLVYVLALKEWSTEVFYDAQNTTGSPLGPVQGAKINYGCISADSVQEIDGTLFWLATNRSSAVQVLMVDNLKAGVVSTKPIERLLGEADFSRVASFGIKYEGHRFYGFTLKNNNITLVYDMTDKMWAQWTDQDGNYFKIVSTTYKPNTGRILQHETNGKLYLMDSEYFSDDGQVITVDLYTPNYDGGVRRRKQMTMMEFIGDQTSGSKFQVRTNDFDYDPTKWTNFRAVDMSVRKPTLANNGTFMRRATHIRHQCDTRMRLQAIECQLDIGTL
jgi:hypothetical protein